MALIKKIDSGAGYSIEYWRIKKLDISLDATNLVVTFAGYIDAEARKNNLKAVRGQTLLIPAAAIDLNGNIRQQVYDWAIAQEDSVSKPGNFAPFRALQNKNNFFAKAKKDKGQK